MNILTIALFCEGPTDQRFLEPLIERTYEIILMSNTNRPEIEVFIAHMGKSDPKYLVKNTKKVEEANRYSVAIIHADADSNSPTKRLGNVVQPILDELSKLKEPPIGVPLIPVYEIEAWMLADFGLLQKELNTTKTKQKLGLTQTPENIADPKAALNQAIYTVRQDMPPKLRKEVDIKHLYEPLGNTIPIQKLQQLSSYQAFYKAAEQSLKQLNFIP